MTTAIAAAPVSQVSLVLSGTLIMPLSRHRKKADELRSKGANEVKIDMVSVRPSMSLSVVSSGA
ncbi:MAG: hypothetical protein E5Y89_14915 [Mesorhizobium sp.]|nr:MAG: hypothetical protein E5Y89_14915 [Mesorhizobium sp.]